MKLKRKRIIRKYFGGMFYYKIQVWRIWIPIWIEQDQVFLNKEKAIEYALESNIININ